jgi:tetratricopeptide (TPR) repeat protein
MGYSKTKHVDAAQKHLGQGRVDQAIAEYQQILKHEPGDQVTLMTVGDLYVRQGETFQAIDYFARLAQIFVRDGFFTKAIAIYKKIAKLAPEEMKPLERLAELYVQQGILSEARPLFLQLAEGHIKAGRKENAAALLRKLLEAEPDNLRVQLRLAEIQIAMDQKKDAAQTFLACADRHLQRREPAEALKLIDRALDLSPKDDAARFLKARALAQADKPGEAAELLESLPDVEATDENAEQLLDLYLQDGRADRAASLAERALEKDPKRYGMAGKVILAMLESGDGDGALSLLDQVRKSMSENGDAEALSQLLQVAATRLPGRLEPHEWLVQLYQQVNDAFHLPEAMTHLAQTAAAAGQFERARQVYEQLVERSPEDANLRKNLEQVRSHLGLGTLPESDATTPATSEAPASPPVAVEPALDPDTEKFVSLALTDVDLFASYGLTRKAISLLETVLERAPRHAPSLEKLLDMYLGEGDNERTAELAGTLSEIYTERGDTYSAERFAELHRRFQRAAALDPKPQAAPVEFSLPGQDSSAGESAEEGSVISQDFTSASDAASALSGQGIHSSLLDESNDASGSAPAEIDLSDEWAAASETPLEIHREELHNEKLEEAPAKVHDKKKPEPISVEADFAPFLLHEEPAAKIETFDPAEYELELIDEAPKPANVSPIRPAPVPTNGSGPGHTPAAPPVEEKFPVPSEPMVAASDPGGPLSEIFNEFRDALDELQMDEDPETHYNLGIAYREMGLLEEAISEFQKVIQAHDRGKPFQYSMQCCTLLALAFMEKGQAEIAAYWYERALKTPGLDQEAVLALRYDLGVAQDLAGQTEAALKSFQQVYAINIDYRDVAERIGSLRHS